jgi:Na+/H+-translocating membrane pyrophosphatase
VKILKYSVAFLVSFFAPASTAFASQARESAAAAGIPTAWWIAPLASVAALVVAYIFYKKMMAAPEGNEKMITIAGHIREGAYAYLFSQYKVVGLVFLCLFIVFTALAYLGVQNPFVPVAFLTAGFFSALCGFLGMKTATNASARTAQGASKSLNQGLFRCGNGPYCRWFRTSEHHNLVSDS